MSLYTSGQARRSLIDTMTFRIVSQMATVVGYVVLVRGMTKEDFGVLNLLYAFIPFVSTVASLGLEQTLRRYQPEYLRAGNLPAAAWLVRFVASARFGANVILLSLILLCWNQVAPLFKLTPYRAEFLLLGLLVLVHLQARVLELSLASHMLQRYSVGSLAVLAVVKLSVYCLLWWQDAFTLQHALIADIVAFAVAYAFLLAAYRRHCVPGPLEKPYRPEALQRRRLLRYAAFNNFNDAGTLFLDRRLDSFFIAAIIDPVSVGIYAFYSRLSEMAVNLLPTRLFDNVVQPMFFAVDAESAEHRLPQYFSLLLNLNLVLLWPVLAFALVYHAEIVLGVFGGKFVEDSWLLPIIVVFELINAIGPPVGLVAQYEEKVDIILYSKIFGIYNVIALVTLIPIFGIFGAALASGSAQAMKNGFIWWHVRKRGRWTNATSALLSSLALWGAIVVACLVLKAIVGSSPVLNLCGGLLMVAAGVLVHIRGPAISAADRAILASVFHGKELMVLRRLGLLARARPAAGPG